MRTVLLFLMMTFFCVNSLFAQQMELQSFSENATARETEDSAPVQEFENTEPTRDPFSSGLEGGASEPRATAVSVSNSGGEPVLQGLAIKGDKASAVISGKTYNQGEAARNGIEVVEVRKGEADIRWGGQNKTLRFLPKNTESQKRFQTSATAGYSGAAGTEAPIFGSSPAPMEDSK